MAKQKKTHKQLEKEADELLAEVEAKVTRSGFVVVPKRGESDRRRRER